MNNKAKCKHHRNMKRHGQPLKNIAIASGNFVIGFRDLNESELEQQNASTYCVHLKIYDPLCNSCDQKGFDDE